MITTSRMARGAAVAAAAALVATGGTAFAATSGAQAGHPAAAAAPAFSRIPFTSAAVTANASAGTLTVSWDAPHALGVLVFAGSGKDAQPHYLGLGRGADSLTATAKYGDWIKLVPVGGEPLVLTVRDLGLASDPNLRDAGGYRTADGQWVRMGLVYRSAALSLSTSDLAAVDALGITADYDLRTPAEIAATPDDALTGATYTNINILGASSASISGITTAAEATAAMQEGEREFVTGSTETQGFGELLTDIANADGPVLYHCSAGKDRTGWASAVLLTLLGVPEQTVMQDYLLSNTYYFDSPAVQAMLKAMPAAEAAVYAPFMEVQASYLQAGFDQVKASYGSMYDYAVKGLGLSPQTIAKLRAKMLVG